MDGIERVRKLKWLCRRGMKELDILLDGFIEHNRDALAAGAWPEFETLLQMEDDVLWDGFQDSSAPATVAYTALLKHIRGDRC